jgi:hypothetical protein
LNILETNGKKYRYSEEVTVGMFQNVINLIKDVNDLVIEENMTAGKFAGILANEQKLVPMVATLLEIDIKEVEKFPVNKAIEVCNNFFYTNGFWLMISNHFSMPSEVKEMLENQVETQKKTPLPNSENTKTELKKAGTE